MQVIKPFETIYSIGVLWNISNEFYREMMKKIAISNPIIQIRKYDMGDKYIEFVRRCYQEDVSEGYLSKKVNRMEMSDDRNMIVFVARIDDPEYEFISMKYNANIISWESDSIDTYDILIIRSIWGYQYKYNKFIKWLKKVERRNKILVNSYRIIKKCIDKEIQYQVILRNNIPLIPYKIIDANNKNLKEELNKAIDFFSNEGYDKIVIKPTISESGAYTYLFTENNKIQENNIKLEKIIIELKDMIYNMKYEKIIVQPFFDEIYHGEYSCIVLNGKIIRKMIRYPGIFTKRKEVIKADTIYDDEKEFVEKICECGDYEEAVYMRVDYLKVKDEFKLMELELLDPDLLTRNLKEEAEKKKFIKEFACAILKGIKIT